MGDEIKKPTCFVVMGFGKKTDFETGRTLDLDKSYQNMIKPAVEAAGLTCIRADEIVHSGMIDVPMYEQLMNADVVVADISTSNKNAFYELGVRHALKPYTTLIISEDGVQAFPFDLNHVVIRKYHHLGEDIGFGEVVRFSKELTKSIKEILAHNPRRKDSPVYSILTNLNGPQIIQQVQDTAAVNKASTKNEANDDSKETYSMLMQRVNEAQKKGDWPKAKAILTTLRDLMKPEDGQVPEDAYILQRLALATYKSAGSANPEPAFKEARAILELLTPHTSNDTETLGLWGTVHKWLWDITKETQYLDQAIRAYERGFNLRNDQYNGINFAYMLNVRAKQSKDRPEDAITDFVLARRVRKEVLEICGEWLKKNAKEIEAAKTTNEPYTAIHYWIEVTRAEALTGLGETAEAQKILDTAYSKAPESWMPVSTKQQIAALALLLEDSPLHFIKA